jgi:hypothetical protein
MRLQLRCTNFWAGLPARRAASDACGARTGPLSDVLESGGE